VKNFFCILMLSNGTPMFCAGDEFLDTRRGNNNPYNQDNDINYLDWDLLEKNHDVFRFFQGMIAFRKAHPSIARSQFWREDIHWYGAGPFVDFSPGGHTLAFCLHGGSLNDGDVYAMINASASDVPFRIQEGQAPDWLLVADTSLQSPGDFVEPGERRSLGSVDYMVGARSVVVLYRPPMASD
jgi:glycogen operon protein